MTSNSLVEMNVAAVRNNQYDPTRVASEYFSVPYDQVTPAQRATVKSVAHAFLYGANMRTLYRAAAAAESASSRRGTQSLSQRLQSLRLGDARPLAPKLTRSGQESTTMTKQMIELNMVAGENEDGTEITTAVAVDIENVRDFYPRKRGRTGTRILFRNGSALAVSDRYQIVRDLMVSAGVTVFSSDIRQVEPPAPAEAQATPNLRVVEAEPETEVEDEELR